MARAGGGGLTASAAARGLFGPPRASRTGQRADFHLRTLHQQLTFGLRRVTPYNLPMIVGFVEPSPWENYYLGGCDYCTINNLLTMIYNSPLGHSKRERGSDMSKIAEGGDGASAIAASALRAQQARMRVIAENMANSDSTATTPGGAPYRRQVPVFSVLKLDGGNGVQMSSVAPDPSAFGKVYEPGHPSADKSGYVLLSNVNGLIESLDMRSAMRAYEANISVLENQDAMEKRTLDLLKR
jgi:flagellar basal-body rod protein FlgC